MVKLSQLFQNAPDIEVKSIMSDSRKKRQKAIFFCIKGMMFDGHHFIDQAIENGAIVIVYSELIEKFNPDIIYIKVKNVSQAYNQVVSAFYGHPSKKLTMYGVTGTNGKSSVATMIKTINNHFESTGYIGTIGIEYENVKLPPLLTTPESDALHGVLKDMVDANVKACALEVSSIGIDQGRVNTIDFDVAIFTNLTHDHLDYHGTMTNYFESKKQFFDNMKMSGHVITNVDDPYGRLIVADTFAKVITIGISQEATFQAKEIQLLKDRTIFKLCAFNQTYEVTTNLVAIFNVYNLLCVIAALYATGHTIESILPYVRNIKQIEGRMERIDEGQSYNVLVDFAHTPDGIEQVLQFASRITPKENRIIAVIGSAGQRDVKKRKIFGELCDQYCDMIILTEDDPRNESPYEIAEEIATGIKDTTYIILENRYHAIEQAVLLASDNDTIILFGKGNERFIYREFGRETYAGDDAIAREVILKRLKEEQDESID